MSSDADTFVADLRRMVARFVEERDWRQFHDPKNLAMSIAIEAAELMERFQWVRTDELPAVLASEPERAKIEDEVADIACYLLSFVNALDIDLSAAVQAKIAKNEQKYPVERFRGRYFKPGGSSP